MSILMKQLIDKKIDLCKHNNLFSKFFVQGGSEMLSRNLVRVLTLVIVIIVLFVIVVGAQEYWAIMYGASGSEWGYAIQEAADGGYIMTGPTTSFGAGGYDIWVVKLDSSANIVWQRSFGGSSDEVPNAIKQTSNGNYVIAGRTNSYGAGGLDFFVLRLDAAGNLLWFKTYGGSGDEYAYSISETTDNGLFLVGGSSSFGAGNLDYCVIKLDFDGNITWQRVYGGGSIDMPYAGQQTADDGYILAGGGASVGAGGYDIWIVKLDSSGNIAWQKAFGGSADDLAFAIQQTSDSGYIVAGRTSSYGVGGVDFWVLRLDSIGNIIWQRTYGGGSTDWAFGVRQTNEGDFVVAGRTDSYGAGNADYWVLKLNDSGNILWQKTYGGSALDYAYSINLTSDGGYIVTGVNGSYTVGGYDVLSLKLDSYGNVGIQCSIINISSATPVTPQPAVVNTSVTPVPSNMQVNNIIPNIVTTTATKSNLCYFALMPGRVLNNLFMTKSGNDVILNWQAPGGICDVINYGVYRGDLPIISYNHTFLSCAVAGLSYTDSSASGSYYYLVVPLNKNKEGSYGRSFDGVNWQEIQVGSPACLPQLLLVCN